MLPLYFKAGEQDGGRNDFLGTKGLTSFGVTRGGYVGFYDPEKGEHITYAAPDDTKARRRIAVKDARKAGRGYVRKRGDATLAREDSNELAFRSPLASRSRKGRT